MDLQSLLGDDADDLLSHRCKGIPAEDLIAPGPSAIDDVMSWSDRPVQVLRSLASMYGHGRLANTGYLSILPVDQGIEHSGAASFAKNPVYFDPKNIVELAIEGGCNAVATTFGVLGDIGRRYAHRIPFIVKLNHNELLAYPISTTRSCSPRPPRPTTSVPLASERRSTSAPSTPPARSRKCPRPSRRPTSSACSPSCGATYATTRSAKTASITRSPPI